MNIIQSTRPELVIPIIYRGILPGTMTGEITNCNPLRGTSPYIYLSVLNRIPEFSGWGSCHIQVKESYVRDNAKDFMDYSDQELHDYFINFVNQLGIQRLPEEATEFKRHLPTKNQIVSLAPIPPEALEVLVCGFEEINGVAREINPLLKIVVPGN